MEEDDAGQRGDAARPQQPAWNRQAQVAPETCVYVDDVGVNCKPAAGLGMVAIKVTSEAQALADLSAATGLCL